MLSCAAESSDTDCEPSAVAISFFFFCVLWIFFAWLGFPAGKGLFGCVLLFREICVTSWLDLAPWECAALSRDFVSPSLMRAPLGCAAKLRFGLVNTRWSFRWKKKKKKSLFFFFFSFSYLFRCLRLHVGTQAKRSTTTRQKTLPARDTLLVFKESRD